MHMHDATHIFSVFFVSLFALCLFIYLVNEHQQPRQRQSVLYAPNAAPLGNQANLVVAVAEVLGSEPAGVLVTQKTLATRGTRASGPAKHSRS